MISSYCNNLSEKTKVISFYLTTGEFVSAFAVKQEEDGTIFLFSDLLDNVERMHSDDVEDIYYADTELRSWLNQTFVKQFPAEIVKEMLPFENGDFIRLPTEREILGENVYGELETESIQQWELMENSMIRGVYSWYWLQTKAVDRKNEFCCITSSGNSNAANFYLKCGVRPVFKLKNQSEKNSPTPNRVEEPVRELEKNAEFSDLPVNKKFKMELTWHNCWECPPEEVSNDGLIATDGKDYYNAFWYRPNGFMIQNRCGWTDVSEDQNNWWWADLRRTILGNGKRF